MNDTTTPTFNALDAVLAAGVYTWVAFGRTLSATVEAVAADRWLVRSPSGFVAGRVDRVGDSYFALARTAGVGLEESFASPYRAVAFALGGRTAVPPIWTEDGKRSDDPLDFRPAGGAR